MRRSHGIDDELFQMAMRGVGAWISHEFGVCQAVVDDGIKFGTISRRIGMRDFCALQLIHSLRRLRLDDEAIASARSPRGIEQVSIQRRIHTRPQNARGGSRTRGLWLRRPTLYPTELPAQNNNLKKKPVNRRQKRETGLEPATSTLARLHSTTELLSHTIERTQIRSVGDGGLYACVPYLSSLFFIRCFFLGRPISLSLNTGSLFCQFAHLLRQRRHAGIGNVH